ncbi:MAG: branched-chain amino acid ABC transporter permease [Candidatus Eremiobacteraeota bacterium]|nr:branched-chain amino acid ABC transporter permease [Candidatus Eremiobacteraeota bacterium]MBV8355027.1 branched-chain amino acid ABC transporter permease [Candidatus Eremiobacteraeota bacterium]
MQLFFQDLVNGILTGGILALVALGFSLVWGIMNIINLAHGAFLLLGAYVTYQMFTSFHLDPFASIPIAFIVLFALGYLIQRYIINFVVRAPVLTTFLLTFGLSLLLVNVILLIWTGDTRAVTPAYSGSNFALGGVTIPIVKLLTLVVALVITALAQLWLAGTKMGRAVRATAMDVGAAQLSGVKVAQIYAIVFGLSAGLAGAAGSLVSVSFAFSPSSGDAFLIKGFIVCVLGGLGSVQGALVGGLVYGIVETFASQYIGTGYADAVALIVLLLVLIFRPTGIMGRALA